jgi:hypothetical protein
MNNLRRLAAKAWEWSMKATKRTIRTNSSSVPRVVRTTVGELIASMVDAVGTKKTRELLTVNSPLQRVLRQRLVLA